MELQNVLYERRAGVAYVTVNRPKALNALDRRTLAELREVFEEIAATPRFACDRDRRRRQGVHCGCGHPRDRRCRRRRRQRAHAQRAGCLT